MNMTRKDKWLISALGSAERFGNGDRSSTCGDTATTKRSTEGLESRKPARVAQRKALSRAGTTSLAKNFGANHPVRDFRFGAVCAENPWRKVHSSSKALAGACKGGWCF